VFRHMLPLSAAQLQLVFARRGEVDHCEIALRASTALGSDENPTDLALAMDYRIRHILVDEFQDTSSTQFRLLESLTRGWAPGDGRTLFLVGDPMQSIYRFREAEVGLFLRARQEGVGQLQLESLDLHVNFRSRRPTVAWVNRMFPHLLAAKEDIGSGAVPFSPAIAFDNSEEGGVYVHPSVDSRADPLTDARKVVALTQKRLAETDQGQVAILVRTRSQAAMILPALREAGVLYQAVEIESLATRPVVQDLLALTRALVNDADRTAWLSVLRAPWCGLLLADLYVLATNSRQLSELIVSPADLLGLSADGQQRLARIASVIADARRHRRRETLRHRVQTTWLALGGPAAASDAGALQDARAFFDLLEGTEMAADLDDANLLNQALDSLYARSDPQADARLQVMTIHKSKGLEFDSVILPGLHAGIARSDSPLLLWMERLRSHGELDLLMAPVREHGVENNDRLYQFVKTLIQEKEEHELGRLLYVAITRAVRCVDLFGFVRIKMDRDVAPELANPAKGSLLERLWPFLEQQFKAEIAAGYEEPQTEFNKSFIARNTIRRFRIDWQLPAAGDDIAGVGDMAEEDDGQESLDIAWASQTARICGVVVHRFLQQIAEDGLETWDTEKVETTRPALRAMLLGLGVSSEELCESESRCVRALTGVIYDDRGRWILTAHEDAQNELPLVCWANDGPKTYIIDRTFIDETGTRWVIDYKTSYGEGGDVANFLRQEADKYSLQLRRYADLFRQIENRPIRLALYFPLMGILKEMGCE